MENGQITKGRQIQCYNIIYNSLPYGLLKEAGRVEELGVSSVRLAFTIESREEYRTDRGRFCGCISWRPGISRI